MRSRGGLVFVGRCRARFPSKVKSVPQMAWKSDMTVDWQWVKIAAVPVFCDAKADGRGGLCVGGCIGGLAPFEGFLDPAHGQVSGEGVDHGAHGQQGVAGAVGHGVECGSHGSVGGRVCHP